MITRGICDARVCTACCRYLLEIEPFAVWIAELHHKAWLEFKVLGFVVDTPRGAEILSYVPRSLFRICWLARIVYRYVRSRLSPQAKEFFCRLCLATPKTSLARGETRTTEAIALQLMKPKPGMKPCAYVPHTVSYFMKGEGVSNKGALLISEIYQKHGMNAPNMVTIDNLHVFLYGELYSIACHLCQGTLSTTCFAGSVKYAIQAELEVLKKPAALNLLKKFERLISGRI